jgi:hypothetical protein
MKMKYFSPPSYTILLSIVLLLITIGNLYISQKKIKTLTIKANELNFKLEQVIKEKNIILFYADQYLDDSLNHQYDNTEICFRDLKYANIDSTIMEYCKDVINQEDSAKFCKLCYKKYQNKFDSIFNLLINNQTQIKNKNRGVSSFRNFN